MGKKTGPKPKYEETMTEILMIRLTPEQRALVDKAAQLYGGGTVDVWRELIIDKASEIVYQGEPDVKS